MFKSLICAFLMFTLTACSFFQVHKLDIQQGNVYSSEMVSRLHRGMTPAEVKEVMGNPVFVNIFNNDRMDYVYTSQKGHGPFQEKRVSCIFKNGRLAEVLST